ncbi:MAG: hypothetical protein JWO80_3576 [Bryobacterales bacterium]|nr:hypothetical protein [Bryobacterales bacterium]
MRTMTASGAMRCGVGILCGAIAAHGQPPFRGHGPSRPAVTSDSFVERMMVFDGNHDGELTRSEITDTRLLRLFDRADANHDGVVTKDELKALYTAEAAVFVGRPGGGPPGQT